MTGVISTFAFNPKKKTVRLFSTIWEDAVMSTTKRRFFCCKIIRPTTAGRCGLNHVAEVTMKPAFHEAGVHRLG
jgi:hypothetical protein